MSFVAAKKFIKMNLCTFSKCENIQKIQISWKSHKQKLFDRLNPTTQFFLFFFLVFWFFGFLVDQFALFKNKLEVSDR